ncbi:iron complex transport system permease protein [Stackebrandtia albiflava]|uniref:Iron complex transport system permease protein n=1 Tax=Stackebrandtia albiflava TaxID=406432 RepID=A0A562VBL8_9ACTN|nr:iron ABC transporter permease [Stackebrandtia albiflava]TWJ15217.1 iron complex transport system permease protein [Stackebrandtia albiflava]
MRPHPGTVVIRYRRFSVLLRPRPLAVGIGLLGAVAAACALSVAVGNGETTGFTAVQALWGGGEPVAGRIVHVLRVPRFVAGLVAGAALGIAGCLIQTLARNRLATPDLVGVNDGATVAVLLSVVGGTAGAVGAWWAGPVGAMAAAALVVAVAGGLGDTGYRVLVVGIGLSVAIDAVTELTLARQDIDAARGLFSWTLGYLNGRDYDVALPVGIGLAVLLPPALLAARTLRLLRFGDDTAAGLGAVPTRIRLGALGIAVLLAGLAVGVGGPIAFVAMIAPVLAQRLARESPVPVIVSGLLGGVLVTVADTLGRAFGTVEIPAGVITGILGGPFLLWVLLSRRG